MVLPGKNNTSQEFFRIAGAAIYGGVSTRTLNEWLKNGLRHSKVRGCVLIKREWLNEYIERYLVDQNQVDDIVSEIVREMI